VGVAAVCTLLMTGCAGISGPAKERLDAPVDCGQAQADTQLMKESKASGVWRITQGFQGILPPIVVISLIRGALGKPRGMYVDHWKVAFGSYNQQIDEKLAALARACGS
jgi:hypothetical protein